MPYSSDPNAAKLLAHIQRMLPDLPRILGADWPDFEDRLQALLRQLGQPDVIPVVVEAQVLDLFAPYPRVMKSWRDTTLREGEGQVTERGSADAQSNQQGQTVQGNQQNITGNVTGPVVGGNVGQIGNTGGGAHVAVTISGGDFVGRDRVNVGRDQVKTNNQMQGDKSVTRYTDLRCPGQVSLGREFQVTVRLTLRPNAESRDAQQLSVLTRAPVVVEVDAPDFILTEGNTRAIDIPDDRDSDWAVFGMKPRQSGPAEVRVRFWQGGALLGQAQCDLLVVEQPVTTQAQRLPALPLAFAPGATPPKRILCISLRGETLRFSLYVDGVAVEIPLPPVDLRVSPAKWMQRRYAGLSALAKQAAGGAFDAHEAAEDVKGLGNLLWTDLIPTNLQRLWLDERADWAAQPLLIVSDEAHIPWELVWPNEKGVDVPWGAHGPMSRWLGVDARRPVRCGPSERLALTPWAGIFPGDSDLSHLPAEAALLRRLLPQAGERTPASLRRRDVLAMLAEGDCTWLHAGTHGQLDPAGEAEGAALLLEGKGTLEPEVLVRTAVREGLEKAKPGVFWNICHGAAGGWSLTGVGGWAGRLIDGGASLFLSPQWTVTDKAALRFAESFYSRLTGGAGTTEGIAGAVSTVAVAAQQARLAARELAGDPSWLAYALYAHPCATASSDR